MDELNNLFLNTLQNEISTKRLGAKLFKEKFLELGIDLTKDQIKMIENHIERNELTNLKLDFSSDQLGQLTSLRNGDCLHLDFTEVDFQNLNEKIEKIIQEIIQKLVPEMAHTLYRPLMSNRKKILAEERKNHRNFQKIINEKWGQAFDIFELFISFNEHLGEEFINSYQVEPKHEDAKVEVLVRLHARSIQVSREILTLMKNGFADGAYARWRTLYEISVICGFVEKNDYKLAERFLDYDAVETYKAADEYQKYYEKLNRDPISLEDFQTIKQDYNEMLEKYGVQFGKEYGWANEVIRQKKITFKDIENSIGLEHLRPLYKRACFNVHSGPRGIVFRMGMHEEADLLLSGSSIYGLYDPCFDTSYSLSVVTADLLSIISTLDSIVNIEILMKFRDEVIQALSIIDESL